MTHHNEAHAAHWVTVTKRIPCLATTATCFAVSRLIGKQKGLATGVGIARDVVVVVSSMWRLRRGSSRVFEHMKGIGASPLLVVVSEGCFRKSQGELDFLNFGGQEYKRSKGGEGR